MVFYKMLKVKVCESVLLNVISICEINLKSKSNIFKKNEVLCCCMPVSNKPHILHYDYISHQTHLFMLVLYRSVFEKGTIRCDFSPFGSDSNNFKLKFSRPLTFFM